MSVSSASVLICTYNRARLLHETLAALSAMKLPAHCEAEIVVIDNNSTDNTPTVIADVARHSKIPIVAGHEARQGKSFALNTGLSMASGDIIALTDDDVWPAEDWLERIVLNFRERDVIFVFGKVLPKWAEPPPPELLLPRAQEIWGPLAIVDYGDTPDAYLPETWQRLPVGANLSFQRAAMVTIGGWRTDLGKVDNTLISGEDHEIFARLRRHGLYRGYYDPSVVVRHLVPSTRLTRRYFRKWFFWHGKTLALMLDYMFPDLDISRCPKIAGVPRFLYRRALEQCWLWVKSIRSGDALGVLIEELTTFEFAGLFAELWRRHFRPEPPARGAHVAS
jgi:glycosyltransferase involved in cell wall biosynthesis